MVALKILIDATTVMAVETYYGETIKYMETFNTWEELFVTLGKYMDDYAEIVVRRDR